MTHTHTLEQTHTHTGSSNRNASYLYIYFYLKYYSYIKQNWHHRTKQIFSYKTVLHIVVTIIGYAFALVIKKHTILHIAPTEAIHFVTTEQAVICCSRSPSFIDPKRWKLEIIKSKLCLGVVGHTSQNS